MELWIRSQDRKKLEILQSRLRVQETQVNPHSHWFGILVDGDYFGEYNSEERALEVLDEIQNILKPQILIRKNDDNDKVLLGAFQKGITQKIDMEFKELSTYVYEMPKE